jgi:hypothetical protein
MKHTVLKDNVLTLIDLKQRTTEIIQRIYTESQDMQLCIYDDNSVFCESPLGFETLAKIFKKRIVTCPDKSKGKYPIKKYFEYKGIEFFCLYKLSNTKGKKAQKIADTLGKAVNVLKTIGIFVWRIIKAIAV